MRSLAYILLAANALCVGCGDETHELFVDVRTDLAPGTEFDEIRAELRDDRGRLGEVLRTAEAGVLSSHDYSAGRRVAEWSDIASGDYVVRVDMRLGGAAVADIVAEVVVSADRAITIFVSRDCAGVTCPALGGDPGATSCLAGVCVSPRCVLDESAEGCPDVPMDAGVDAPTDAFVDVGTDSGSDAGADSGADSGSSLAAGDLCPQLARVLCEGRQTCCSMPTPEDCQITMRDSCLEFFGRLALEPASGWDPARGAEILARIEAAAITCSPEVLPLIQSGDGIVSAFRGTVSEGGACVAAPTVPLELLPYARIFSCTDGLTCMRLGTEYTCRPLGTADDPCVFDFHCDSGLYCGVEGFSGRCAFRLPTGSECTAGSDCVTFYCDTSCGEPSADEAWCGDPFAAFLP